MSINNKFDPGSIFITQTEEQDKKDLSGKITMTNVLETIPKNALNKPLKDWNKYYKTEWRWRFLDLSADRSVVEISYQTDNEERMYFNKSGEFVVRKVDPIYDKFVTKIYYSYTE